MSKIRAAVIGVGYLGRFHAQKYAQPPACEFVAVVDGREEVRKTVAAEVSAQAVADYRELLGKVDAVSVVTPTPAHFEIADAFLAAGAHVLVEKPITETPDAGEALIATAAKHGKILQVGHLERFNAAVLAAEPHLREPRFMECVRLAPYKERGTDVNVVLDLMIHDIDLVQSLAASEIVSIDAIGTPVFSGEIDIANAASAVRQRLRGQYHGEPRPLKTERKLRIFEDAAYISLDLQQKILTLIRKRDGVPQPGQLPVSIEEANLEQGDALKSEIESFLDCIRNNKRPIVSGEDGLRALETAIRITEQVHANLARSA